MEAREIRKDFVLRVRVLSGVASTLLMLVAASYWFTQGVQGSYYRELAENNRLRQLATKAPRGLIFDRARRLLVENVPSYNLMMDRSRSRDPSGSLEFAAAILERPVAELQVLLERYRETPSFTPVLMAEDLALSQVARFEVATLEHPEFEVEVFHRRLFRYGPQTAHVLGFLGEVSQQELAREPAALHPGDLVGKQGVERAYDSWLRGEDGERVVVVDSRGKLIEEYGRRPARAGENLILTLDLSLQQEAEYFFENRAGAAVALDPRNGEVLLLFSSPSYNPNLFAHRLEPQEWEGLLAAPHHPLQNRALQSAYSPGSIFKIVLALAGLSEGLLDEHDRTWCGGSVTFYNHRFRCWRRSGHGYVDLRAAFKHSCDVYFYHLGKKLGIEIISDYARRLGFGAPTEIDLMGEKSGLVPDPIWSLRVRRSPWYPGETISVAIGQGPLLVTPLQLASIMATVANGGFKVRPHLYRGADQAERELRQVDPANLSIIREALWAVVNEGGTGSRARVPGMDVAGKTGTVQVVEQESWIENEDLPYERRDHAWFASFAPLVDPRLVVVVFVEHGGKGSEAAAPLARALYEKYRQAYLSPGAS